MEELNHSAYYRIDIKLEDSESLHNQISDLLKVQAKKESAPFARWSYEVVSRADDDYFDFINEFLNLLEPRFEKLERLGVKREDISIWFLYNYDQQCNMEFDSQRMKRLGESGVTLCISCWEK